MVDVLTGYACVSAGKLVYHGPREDILPFFESQHMHCPERKADSDFLQEVTSRKDQQVCPLIPACLIMSKGCYSLVLCLAIAPANCTALNKHTCK